MLVNPIYGASGSSPTPPSSGYVEGAVAIYENSSWETADLYQSVTGQLGLPILSTSQNFTFEARVAPSLYAADNSSFFGVEANSNYRLQFGLTTSQKDATADYGILVWGLGTDVLFKPVGIRFDEWRTFTFCANSSGVKLYIDGTFFEMFTPSPSFSFSISPIATFQMYYPLVSRQTRGKWGCTRWYNRVLTIEEIVANYTIDARKYSES